MKRNGHKRRILFVVLALAMGGARADDATSTFGFAEHLFDRQEYYRAITEYERFLFRFPDHADAGKAHLRIAEAYLEGGDFEEAIPRLDELGKTLEAPELARLARLRLAGGLYSAERYDDVLSLDGKEPPYPELTALKALCHLRHNAPDLAGPLIAQAQADGFDPEACGILREATERLHAYPRRSPRTAGLMSAFLPGAGQLYVGRTHDAMWAFGLNALFIGASYYAFENGEDVAGAFALSAEAVWYTGNIYNAANGALKFNEDQQRAFFDDLDRQLPREHFSVVFYRTAF